MLAILGSRGIEIDLLCARAEIGRSERYAGMKFFLGAIDSAEVVLANPGAGRISSAAATQIVIDRFDADQIIFIGPASPLVPYLQHGDLVVGERLWQFEADRIAADQPSGDAETDGVMVSADRTMLQQVETAYRELFSRKSNRPQLISGTIVSDNHGLFSKKTISLLHREFGAIAVDHAGATVAEVCHMNARPFAVIRVIRDVPAESEGIEAAAGLEVVPEHLAALVCDAFIEKQPALVTR